MGFREIAEQIPYPKGASQRFKRLDAFERLLDNRFYDHLPHAYEDEDDGTNYIKLLDRRPSVKFNAATVIVDQLTGLLWGDEQPPRIVMREDDDEDYDDTQERAVAKIRERMGLDTLMARVFRRGNVGSVGIALRALEDGRPFIRIIRGKNAMPVYDERNPLDLVGLIQIYPVSPQSLVTAGYEGIDETEKFYWMRIEYDAQEERWFHPLSDTDYQRLGEIVNGKKIEWVLKKEYSHKFGVIPVIWIRNLDEEFQDEDDPDGPCTFGQVLENIVSLDYQLSQIARGYKYTADPMLAIQQGELVNSTLRPMGQKAALVDQNGNMIKSPKNVIHLGQGGSAEMVEITGQGLAGSIEFAKLMREWTLEIMSANKADSEHTKGVMSGRALDILHRALRLLKNRQRVAYGDKGLLPLMRLILIGIERGEIRLPDVESVPSSLLMRLEWPTEDVPDEAALLALATAAETFVGGSQQAPIPTLSREDVIRMIAARMGWSNASDLIKRAEADRQQLMVEQQQQADADASRQIDVAAAKPNPARSGKDK
jgi:hypothetical protein